MSRNVKWLLAFFGFMIATVAMALTVNGELKKAMLEKLVADPTAIEARIYWNTVTKAAKIHNGTSWLTVADSANTITNPMTTTGDIIYSLNNSGTPARLAGSSGVLHGATGTAPSYSTIVNADVHAAAAITSSKILVNETSLSITPTSGTLTLRGGTFEATGTTGVNSSAVGNAIMHWIQVGNNVFVTGQTTTTCITATNTETKFTQTLPVTPAINFDGTARGEGLCVIQPTTAVPYTVGFITTVSAAKTMVCNYSCANNAAGRMVNFSFSYMTN